MKKRLTAFQFLIILIAAGSFSSQLAINAYYELRGSSANLDTLMEKEITDFYKSTAYVDRFSSDSIAIANLNAELEQKRERNAIELKRSGRMIYFGESLQAPTETIKQINKERDVWANAKISNIKNKYDAANKLWLNKWGGFGLVFVFESLALIFGFLAPRRQEIYKIFGCKIRLEFWGAVLASLYAQRTSCLITEKGLLLLLGDKEMAEAYSLAFMMLVPFFYWIGGMDIEEYGKPKIKEPTARVTERTESIEFSKKHTISETQKEVTIKPENPDEAIDLYAQKKISAENGWSQRRIAKEYFGGKLTEVNTRIKRREIELAKFELV